MSFNVSVIIPVYNCEQFVEKAISSALMQPQVCEVVVVNDGSTDASETIITQLQTQHPKIKLYHHLNKVNKGRSATRNLGIQNAIGNYIAFLDADDFYLEKRFKNDQLIFENNPKAHGVYNAIGVHFYRSNSMNEESLLKLYTLSKETKPENLFEALLTGKNGHISIVGLTVKKSVFNIVGCFNESLIVAEDTELMFKMSLKCTLLSGILNSPVAKRGVHDSNVYNRRDLYTIYDLKLYECMYVWSSRNKMDLKIIERFLERIWILKYRQQEKKYKYMYYWIRLNMKAPRLLFSHLGVKYFPLVKYLKRIK